VYRALGDRVPLWATLNEPWVVAHEGYLTGNHAPGHRNRYEAPIVARNLVRAHGAAVQAFRAERTDDGEIGVVVNIEPKYPASEAPEDAAAARLAEAYMNRQFLDPMLLGHHPVAVAEIFGDAWPEPTDEDLALAWQPVDWVGINYYTRAVVRAAPDAWPDGSVRVRQPRSAYTEMDWEVYPQGLADTLAWFRDRYGPTPLYVTENGAAFYDPPTAGGATLDDPLRVAYLRDHLRAVRGAIEDGVDVRGYYAWSLLDNFEWGHGYTKRFGIVHVDLETQRRTMKASARLYADVIRTNGAALG
jgi:beta-glucosidase